MFQHVFYRHSVCPCSIFLGAAFNFLSHSTYDISRFQCILRPFLPVIALWNFNSQCCMLSWKWALGKTSFSMWACGKWGGAGMVAADWARGTWNLEGILGGHFDLPSVFPRKGNQCLEMVCVCACVALTNWNRGRPWPIRMIVGLVLGQDPRSLLQVFV